MANKNKLIQISFIEKITRLLIRKPHDKEQIIQTLRYANQNSLLSSDTLAMLEGVIHYSDLQIRDIMIPRNQMSTININSSLENIFKIIIAKGHSRFPVIADNIDDVIGILHAKDLIPYQLNSDQKFDLNDILRPPVFIPESKPLDILLKDFKSNKNHMAIVVDEYGGVAGFATIEDIIEQIVGDIADEFDSDEDLFVKKHSENNYIIKAHMPIDEFNEYFNSNLSGQGSDTIGGLILKSFAYMPKNNEQINIHNYNFKIKNADNRRIKLLQLEIREHS